MSGVVHWSLLALLGSACAGAGIWLVLRFAWRKPKPTEFDESGWEQRLFRRGAEEVALRANDPDIDRLWLEADDAARAFQAVLEAHKDDEGFDFKATPEYADFREKARVFREACEAVLYAGLRTL